MDGNIRTVIRALRSEGRTVEVLELLLEDANGALITAVGDVVLRVIAAFKAGRIVRAMQASTERLKSFMLIIDNGIEVAVISVERTDTSIIFKGDFEIHGIRIVTEIMLKDDEAFVFPAREVSIPVMIGDILKVTYTLNMAT